MEWIKADKLRALEALVRDITAEAALTTPEVLPPRNCAALAKAELDRRRRREQIFSSTEFFSDPAWDILLELFVADQDGAKLTATSIGMEAAIPQSTVIRWLSLLERHALLQRIPDVTDKRRQWIAITASCRKLMLSYFRSHNY